MNVLVVDDSHAVFAIVTQMLHEGGHTSVWAEDGLKAIEVLAKDAAKDKTISMILLDMNMPNMNGLEFLEKNKSERFTHVPVIIMTTDSIQAKIKQALSLNEADLMMKPFTKEILFNKIALLLRGARELTGAKENFEKRVVERTAQLEKSHESILQQQQVLISSVKMSSLGEMSGGIAHEINTPLAIIHLLVEQIEEGIADDSIEKPDILKSLEIIKKTTNRIATIVSALRCFSQDIKKRPTQLTMIKKIVQDALSFCQERYSNHGVQLEVIYNCDADLKIDCRSVEISQVILNLLNNAHDALEILDGVKWVKLVISDKAEFVELSITDSGPGIPKDIQDKIMHPFFTTKDVGKGTGGLGLSISLGMIESHHGKFFLDAESPHTCFVMQIPKQQIQLDEASLDLKGIKR